MLLAIDSRRFVNIMATSPIPHASAYSIRFVERLNVCARMRTLTDVNEDNEVGRSLVVRSFQEVDSGVTVSHDWCRARTSHRMSTISIPESIQSLATFDSLASPNGTIRAVSNLASNLFRFFRRQDD